MSANLIGMLLFWLRFSAPVLDATSNFFPPTESYSSFLAAQANHYALLQLSFVFFNIVLAGAAIWGYTKNPICALAVIQLMMRFFGG